MIKDEFGFIKRNKLIMLSVLVIMIIPFLYSVFFLKSVWDPYGDTQELPVAVVNKDRAVDYEGKTLDVGHETVKKLRKNKELGWKFVSEKQAAKGLKNNDYYTVVTIPENFSKNAATLLDEHPKKMQLTYKTNDSLNYLSQVISGVGVDKLDKEIRANVTNAYASALFDQIKTVGKGFDRAAKGAVQLNEGTAKLDDGLSTYTVGVSKVHDGIQTMSLKVAPLTSGVQQLQDGANKLNSGLGTYTAGVNQLGNGVNQLQAGVTKPGNGLQAGVAAYTAGTQQLSDGLTQMQQAVGANPDGTNKLQAGTQTIATGVKQYTAGVDQLAAGLAQLNAKVGQSTTDMSDLVKGVDQLAAGANQINQQLQAAGQGATQAQAILDENYKNATAALTAAKVQDKAVYEAVGKLYQTQVAINQKQAEQMQTLTAAIGQLATGTKTLQQAVNNPELTESTKALAAAVQQLNAGASALSAKSAALNGGAGQLADGVGQLGTMMGAVSQLSTGAQQLTQQNAALNSGVAQLAGGLQQLQTGSQKLTGASGQLTGGAGQLAGGMNQLGSQLPQLTDGVGQLLDGTTQLNDNSSQLTDGTEKLTDGTKTLATQLGAGAKRVNGINLTDDTADMMAAPTKVKHTFFSKVKNYGHALAPYVLSLALYVGTLVFNFAYPIRKVSREDGTATQWFFSKVAVGAVVATGMAVVEAGMIMAFGMTVDHLGLFFLIAWLFALASMYLVMFLSMWLDNPGRFIAMVLLMLQLGGSGGTFPMQITNHFYNVIHPYLPMTYSIMGFRQAITSGIASDTVSGAIVFLLGVIAVSLLLLWLVMQRLQKKHLMGVSQLDDNQKLQAVER